MKNLSKYFTLALVAAFALAAVSCSKDDDTETKPYMEGELKFDFPAYVKKAKLLTLAQPRGITKPTEEITYKWIAASMFTDTLVLPSITVRTPDTLGQFAIYAMAFADGYYALSSSVSFTTVDESRNGSLKDLAAPTATFTDPRDGIEYDIVTVGKLQWFAQNLAWAGSGYSYQDSPDVDKIFGRFYTWNQATDGISATGLGTGPQGVCPEGWSVPTNADWEDLTSQWTNPGSHLSANASFNGALMWPFSVNNDLLNSVGWNAVPLGCCSIAKKEVAKWGSYAFYWSATQRDTDTGYYRYIYYDESTMPSSFTTKDDFCIPVRCVRLKP